MTKECYNAILDLFETRKKLRYIQPIKKPEPVKITGFNEVLSYIRENHLDQSDSEPFLPQKYKIKERRMKRIEQNEKKIEEMKLNYRKNITERNCDYNNTIFVGRIKGNYNENTILEQFQVYGEIKKVHLVYNCETQAVKNYCFVEYFDKSSVNNCLTHSKNKVKINDKFVIIDKELGHTDESFEPRKFGGGVGVVRPYRKSKLILSLSKPKKKTKLSTKQVRRYEKPDSLMHIQIT